MVLNNYCSENNGQLASITSRPLWWILGNSIKSKTNMRGFNPFFVNSATSSDEAQLVILGDRTDDTDALVANIAMDMTIMPPSLNYVSNALEHFFFCEYAKNSGNSHKGIEDIIPGTDIGSGDDEGGLPEVGSDDSEDLNYLDEIAEYSLTDESGESEDSQPMMKSH
jgi:hypothetical protein